MAPPPNPASSTTNSGARSASLQPAPNVESLNAPAINPSGPAASTGNIAGDNSNVSYKKKRRRRKKRDRRESFAAPSDDASSMAAQTNSNRDLLDVPDRTERSQSFYRLGHDQNLSNTSMDSEALLDHREQTPLRPRRSSTIAQSAFGQRQGQYESTSYRQSYVNPFVDGEGQPGRPYRSRPIRRQSARDSEEDDEADDRTPLMGTSYRNKLSTAMGTIYGGASGENRSPRDGSRHSTNTSRSSRRRRKLPSQPSFTGVGEYDVNNPPSVPGSPTMGPNASLDNLVAAGYSSATRGGHAGPGPLGNDQIIDIIDDSGVGNPYGTSSSPASPRGPLQRRNTIALGAEEDVCFPIEGLSELGDDDRHHHHGEGTSPQGQRRSRRRRWPELSVLEDWSREEKEEKSERIGAKKINEPVLVGGRLRPNLKAGWHREEEDAPYRFTYFNEEFPSTIHSQTISELVQPGSSFQELFIPDPPELSDDSSEDESDMQSHHEGPMDALHANGGTSKANTRPPSVVGDRKPEMRTNSGEATPALHKSGKPKRYGARPTFWLDVLSPTETEMRVISKAFGIHPLTAEDIMLQEAREKVELFRNYYFVNYRTFEQDMNSDDFLEPVDMYVVVFREGVVSFHFSQTPHPANVRRRIRQLKDYLILTSDWISYAIIDDITDVFAPLIQSIEDEVDDIDDAILQLHAGEKPSEKGNKSSEKSESGDGTSGEKGGDMLRRVGDCRKKVMGLYRLLGNKADVIKGFAKRCNEQWDVAPRSEIGLYLGDIQDHIVTMTSNLSHYEKILSRSHSNYLAQINIRMNERQEQTADVLGRLTVLGTIVLPMNIITGLWGMNCLVPGQDVDNLSWFWGLTAGLLCFGFSCYFIAKKVYRIV